MRRRHARLLPSEDFSQLESNTGCPGKSRLNPPIVLLFLPTPLALGGKKPPDVFLEKNVKLVSFQTGKIDHCDLTDSNFEDDRQPEIFVGTFFELVVVETLLSSLELEQYPVLTSGVARL